VVAFIAVKDKELIFAFNIKRYMQIEILNIIYTCFIYSLVIISYYNTLGG
jgi:hypothetical protein